MQKNWYLLTLLLLTACSTDSSSKEEKHEPSIQAEYIFRLDEEKRLEPLTFTPKAQKPYPWQSGSSQERLTITKEYFRCKGNTLNPPRIIQENGKEVFRFTDCGGPEKHSLPIRDGKEFIYPVLIEILNYVQERCKKAVVITSGHRCPTHNTYLDESAQNSGSKHLIGAEVDFYVQGFESKPELIVKIIQEFYKKKARYQNKKEFLEFKRFDKKSNVVTQPWCNKEIFIKLFLSSEGRNIDNRHPYPYLSMQMRFDIEKNQPIVVDRKLADAFLRK
jgi:hypothetical protein